MRTFALVITAALSLVQVSFAAPVIKARGCYVPAKPNSAIRDQIYRIARLRGVGINDKVMLSTFEAALVESNVNNLPCGDRDALGVFQQRPSQGWGSSNQIMNVSYSTNKYLDQAILVKRRHPGFTPGQIAQAVQLAPTPDVYSRVERNAQQLINQAVASASRGGPATITAQR